MAQRNNKSGNEAAAKAGADSAAKIADRTAREQGKNQKDASFTETTKTGATVHTTVQQNQESAAYCPRVDETTVSIAALFAIMVLLGSCGFH